MIAMPFVMGDFIKAEELAFALRAVAGWVV
jgi:hypothetical protein